MKGDITGVQKIISKILFDHITLVTAANNKFINTKMTINFFKYAKGLACPLPRPLALA